MTYHRKSAMRGVTNPPIALSTFNDMMKDRRAPPPDAYLGRTPLWSDESREHFEQSLVAPRPRRKRDVKRAATQRRDAVELGDAIAIGTDKRP